MLTSILRVELRGLLIPSIEAWERQIRDYETQSGETVPNAIMASVLCSGVQNPRVKEHLALNASRLPEYKAVREEVTKIAHAQRQWTADAVPMEVDSVGAKAGVKGRPKGGGKDNPKGDPKGDGGKKGGKKGQPAHDGTGDQEESRICYYCK